MRKIAITVSPRLHLGLLSMHASAPRLNGGIGFAVDGPKAIVEAIPAARLRIDDARAAPMAAAELDQLCQALDNFAAQLRLETTVAIRIDGAMRTHVGMGSATGIRLAALEALALANDRSVECGVLVEASGRGGTSGIGVNSYFEGGMVCDLGRASDGGGFAPSSRIQGAATPLALPSVYLPAWPIVLCVPRAIATKSQEQEAAFFARTAPLPPVASFEASYVALFEIYAAAAEGNFTGFCAGIESMQRCAWKRAERAEYGPSLGLISTRLHEAGARCVGMSSLGPMLFCLADPSRIAHIGEAAEKMNCEVHHVQPANTGREVHLANA